MLTTEDKDEIKRIIVETFAPARAAEIEQFDRWLNIVALYAT